MVTTMPERPSPAALQERLRGWVNRRPLVAFFALAYLLSWLVWIPATLVGGNLAVLVVGAFGPAVAAYIVLWATGGSVRTWARQIVRWRVSPRYYLYAIGLPALLFAAVNLALGLLGKDIDLSLLRERLPSYLAAFVFVTLLGGGQEEPGWRGFALSRLQARFNPVTATLLLGFLWGLWHLPIYGMGFVGPMMFAFFYTYLYNRTGSIGLCMLLHGGFTAALDNLGLTADDLTVDLTIAGTLVTATLILITLTRGRLGYQDDDRRSGRHGVSHASDGTQAGR
jgi:membrane protease YdiL (CAAX protease family)